MIALCTGISIFGLLLCLAGAGIAAKGVFISEEQASELAGTYWDENLKLRETLLAQSRLARNGLCLVAAGTGFQIISALLATI